MKSRMRAGAILLSGLLAGSAYGLTLTLPQQQSKQDQQDASKQKNKKGTKDQQNSNSSGAQNPPAGNPPPSNPPPASNPSSGDKPTPLFGGTIGLKSSRQTKDSATLGFNGVDPNGQVQKSFLNAAVTPADAMKAQQLAQTTVAPADLVQFLQDGGLNLSAAPQKP
ncbi:MAG: hypothetical protein JSS69_06575 [Acidobacteria bacterium]|nr:hypothetical protein [Acidobacteriota bacterium]MBS1865568.1 hypothetical protein [Acidobacteriota bacterium]